MSIRNNSNYVFESQILKKIKMNVKINRYELFIYFCVWIWANFYSLFKLYDAQTNIFNANQTLKYYLENLSPGWISKTRFKDQTDLEWKHWKFHIHNIWIFLLVQFIVSEILRRYHKELVKYWYIVSSLTCLSYYNGLRALLVLGAKPIIYTAVLFFGGRHLSIWITSLGLLGFYNTKLQKMFIWDFLDPNYLYEEMVYLILVGMAWIELRCISYSIDFINNSKMQEQDKSLTFEDCVNMYSYVLYIPFLHTGPVVLYEDFEKSFQVKNEALTLRLKRFLLDITLFLIYTFILELAFHYFYFLAMHEDMEVMKKLPTIALCGGGLFMGLEFQMKYIISYGTTSAFARLDNIPTPPTPKCVSRIHVYSQMWRHFDVGLYKFLVKYIYRPSSRMFKDVFKLPKMMYKLFASLMTFIFIFLWHGIIWNIFVWSALNYLGITLEHLGKSFSETETYQKFKMQVLKSDAMETRFVAMLCTPLLILSAISNFYLFVGDDIGNLYLSGFICPSLFNSILVYLPMYCCCHVSIALEDVKSRTDYSSCPFKSSEKANEEHPNNKAMLNKLL